MLPRIWTIALNTYREAVRARLLLGVFGLGLATAAYSVVVASLSLHNETRVVADLGAASMSFYGVVMAIVLGSTSLYRELEHKTIFPILSRPIRRWEYLLGKYVGTVLTVAVFIAIDAAAALVCLALEAGEPLWRVGVVLVLWLAALGLALLRFRFARVFVIVPLALLLPLATWFLAAPALAERQLVAGAAVLAVLEVGIVSALATLFASFSSPFLTAAFTATVFVIGRSADTLAHLPKKQFGAVASAAGGVLARVVPNLHTYVPARPLLLDEVAAHPLWPYVALAALHAAAYATALLVLAALVFQKRDFA